MMRPWILLLCVLGFASGAHGQDTPTIEIDPGSLGFSDDLGFRDLERAIQRQIDAYDEGRANLEGRITFGARSYPKSVLRDTLVLFREIAREGEECLASLPDSVCREHFDRSIKKRFRVFTPAAGTSRFTAYYSPDFTGALAPTEQFRIPLYSAPSDPVLRASTREDIVYHGVLGGRGLECAWIDADLFELYSLHIEGGGRIRLVDPVSGAITTKYLTYDGKNGQPLRFFSRLMVEHGWLDPSDMSHASQHRVFLERPEIQRILHAESPSYVYFRVTDEEPVGIDSIPLTERRSYAYDTAYYPVSGILSFTRLTRNDGREISRFMLGQDIGGAIKGPARADLYFGFGEEARIAAESLGAEGRQFFLIRKDARSKPKKTKKRRKPIRGTRT